MTMPETAKQAARDALAAAKAAHEAATEQLPGGWLLVQYTIGNVHGDGWALRPPRRDGDGGVVVGCGDRVSYHQTKEQAMARYAQRFEHESLY